jgi:hypothetical protein
MRKQLKTETIGRKIRKTLYVKNNAEGRITILNIVSLVFI